MSIRSNMSDLSVVLNGEEVNIDDAINDTYREIQSHLNTTQSQLRNLHKWKREVRHLGIHMNFAQI